MDFPMVFPLTHPFHPQDGLGLGDGMISQAVDVLPTATPASPVRGLRFFVAAKKREFQWSFNTLFFC